MTEGTVSLLAGGGEEEEEREKKKHNSHSVILEKLLKPGHRRKLNQSMTKRHPPNAIKH